MVSTKFYAVVYVALATLSTVQALLEFQGILETAYWAALGAILLLSLLKATGVAAYYMHLRWEPRSLTYLIATGVLAAIVLTLAASYSIL